MNLTKQWRTGLHLSVKDLVGSPLPLIQLPPEMQKAKTGWDRRPDVLPIRKHIFTSPSVPERILPPTPSTDSTDDREDNVENNIHVEERKLVYEYDKPEVESAEATRECLRFDSMFESGNLLRAERIYRPSMETNRQEYELLAHPDLNNSAYRQWFYFEVKNGQPGIRYKFSITNLAKCSSLFESGLQPMVYSEHQAKTQDIGWIHGGLNVQYKTTASSAGHLKTLSFEFDFEHANDTVFFACLPPYTYTDLMKYLDDLSSDEKRKLTFKRKELCQTIAKNSCDILTVSSPAKEGMPYDERRVIVISARVHPGESNSSWMMKGMIDYLTDDSFGARTLRNHFVFKIVPMLNPDGVINGNTRVNLAGWDLNRKWSFPVEKLFPTIYNLKSLISTLQVHNKVALYCDLHGHSIHRDIFMYGCCSMMKRSRKMKSALKNNKAQNDPRVFPMIVSKNSTLFSFERCNFKIPKCKLNTARAAVYDLGVTNSYTLEASFCGPSSGPRRNTQFSIADYELLGHQWCQSLLVYYKLRPQVLHMEKMSSTIAKVWANPPDFARSDLHKNDDELSYSQKVSVNEKNIQGALEMEKAIAVQGDLNIETNFDDILNECESAISRLFEEDDDLLEDKGGDKDYSSDSSDCAVEVPQETISKEEMSSATPHKGSAFDPMTFQETNSAVATPFGLHRITIDAQTPSSTPLPIPKAMEKSHLSWMQQERKNAKKANKAMLLVQKKLSLKRSFKNRVKPVADFTKRSPPAKQAKSPLKKGPRANGTKESTQFMEILGKSSSATNDSTLLMRSSPTTASMLDAFTSEPAWKKAAATKQHLVSKDKTSVSFPGQSLLSKNASSSDDQSLENLERSMKLELEPSREKRRSTNREGNFQSGHSLGSSSSSSSMKRRSFDGTSAKLDN